MTEIDYDRLNAEAKRLHDHAYRAGRRTGIDEEMSRQAHSQAVIALELAKVTIERAFATPVMHRESADIASAILYRSCPVTKSSNLDRIQVKIKSGHLKQAVELIESDLRVLKEGGGAA